MICHVNIGSNIGDSLRIIRKAISLISKNIANVNSMTVSSPVSSEPWGFESQNRFVNVGVQFTTTLSPPQLLEKLQQIEQTLGSSPHRNPDGSYHDREIDIDIIHLGDKVIDTPELTVPHPHMAQREFVLLPLAEIDPKWVHPILKKSADQLLNGLRK